MSADDPTDNGEVTGPTEFETVEPAVPGGDLAARTLAQVKAEAVKRMGAAAAATRREASGAASRTRAEGRSTSRRSKRSDRTSWDDPVAFGPAIESLLAARGWEGEIAVASVLGDWAGLVGSELAEHCSPVSLRDGELTLVAESTAWATQIRLLIPTLVAKLAERVGSALVTTVRVHGPTTPSWGHGKLRTPGGRGPRDTYG